MAQVDHRSVLGAIDETHWAQTFTSSSLLIVCEIEGKHAQKKGRQYLKELQTRYRKTPPVTLSDFKKFLESLSPTAGLTYVSALIVARMLYLVIVGRGAVYIKRDDTFAPLLLGAGSASGELKTGDMLLFASQEFVSEVKDPILKSSMESDQMNKIYEKLTVNLHKKTGMPYGSALVLCVKSLDKVNAAPFKTIDTVSHFRLTARSFGFSIKTTIFNFRKPLIFLSFLILVFMASLAFVFLRQKHTDLALTRNEELEQIDAAFNEGMAFIGVDAFKSRELLQTAKTLVNSQLSMVQDETLKKILLEKSGQIESSLKAAQQEFSVSLSPFYELALLKSGAQAQILAVYQDALVLLDRQNQLLYRVEAQSKSGKILAHSDKLGSAKSLAVYGEDVYIASDAVYELTLAGGSFREIIPIDPAWGNISVIEVFSGNLYLMDIGKNWVFKYFKTEEGWGERQDYFVFDTLVNLNGATELVIDGYVWITKSGEILRFSQGSEDVWQVSGLTESLGSDLDIYIDAATTNLYILDKQNNRVVVVDKNGVYLAQYKWQEDLQIADFVVSEPLKKILLLSGGTIYGIELK